ncbi:hypothetical protein BGAL_0185g00100 [Botrytis galanthina]|uniref:2EXR domain-containing protein n=1 Tax=Botrytis galanthina TaxID=278940 RepID=A0A4S8QZN2_9HELO|nr:hypothetical protein BGAL_0185g00100 [Botrytis galanthina]
MAGIKNKAISGSDVPNIPAIENARVMEDHDPPLPSDSINESHQSIMTVANIQSTKVLQEEITHEKPATIDESTVNLELTEGPLVCPWRNTSPNFLFKDDVANNGMWYKQFYRKNYVPGKYLYTWVELERRSSYDKFTCFHRLPYELRRKIWLHALPDPRTISLHLATDSDSHIRWSNELNSPLITATLSFDDDSSANLSPENLLWTCRESSEIFLEHYHRPRGVRPVDGTYHCSHGGTRQAACVRVQSKGWIDFEVDTLVAENIENTLNRLAWLQSRPDFSAITNLAISDTPLYRVQNGSWWTDTVPFLLEEQFPGLKHLRYFGPSVVVKATDVNFMNELKRVLQIERLAIPRFDLDTEELTNSEQRDAALAHSRRMKRRFLIKANMSYWKNVEVTLAFLVHWEKDGEALSFDELQPACESHHHFSFSPYPTSQMHILWWGHEYVIPTYEDGVANGEYWGVRELFDDYEKSDRPKPSQWPWNYERDIVYTLSAMESSAISPESSQPKDQESEVPSINAITATSEQLSLRESISEVAGLQSSEDWEIFGYLSRDQINRINGMGRKPDQETLKLPLELRRKIWFHALPEPRLVSFVMHPDSEFEVLAGRHSRSISLGIIDYTIFTDVTQNKELSHNVRPFFLTCHELKDVFLEHYKSFNIHTQIPADGKLLYSSPTPPICSAVCRVSMGRLPSQCYIDPKADCLKFNNLKESIEILSGIGITLDFSDLRHIAVGGFSKYVDGSLDMESTWKAIEDNFPQLKSVTLSGNYGGAAHARTFPLVIPTLTRFHPLTGDTMGELSRQTLSQDLHGLETPDAWIANTENMDIISTTADVTKKSFLERTISNSTYWKGIDFTISLWMEHTLHRAKDYIQLNPRNPIEGDQDTVYYTQAVGKFDIGSACLKRLGGVATRFMKHSKVMEASI